MMENTTYHQNRSISKSINKIQYLNNDFENETLLDVVLKKNTNIVLLGNPGSGKTKEFEFLFNELWRLKDETKIFPYFINLKKFRKSRTIEDLILFEDWKKIPNIIFILDGLDEVSDIQDFISELEIFKSKFKYRFVLSCRSSVYIKYLINIPDFEIYYLNDLTFEQSKNILLNQYNIKANYSLEEFENNFILHNPFSLKVISESIKNETLIINSKRNWEDFIDRTANDHIQKLIKTRLINKPKLLNDLSKIAILSELQQKNFIKEDEIEASLDYSYLEFIDNPFFRKIEDSECWEFIHRQIQEYFVSRIFLKKDFKFFKDAIRIPGTNEIRANYINIISFVINFLETNSQFYIDLLDWLKKNNIEILFKLDINRLKDIQVDVFQNYFNKQCIEKAYWIGTNSNVSDKELARFGNCDENIKFLLYIIENTENHFRARISAISILSEFNISRLDFAKIKPIFISYLENYTANKAEFNTAIIYFFKNSTLIIPNQKQLLINLILDIFKDESNKTINRALLGLLHNEEDLDQYIDFIEKEFKYEFKIIPRIDVDDVFRGNDWILKEFILKLKDEYNFLKIAIHFVNDYNLTYDNEFTQKLIERFKDFSNNNNDFIINFLKAIKDKNKKSIRHTDDMLTSIITICNKKEEAFDVFIDTESFNENIWLLAHICTKESIEKHIETFIVISNDNQISIEHFRNYLFNTNQRELARFFESIMIKNGLVFSANLLSESELFIKAEILSKIPQQNLDLYCNKDSIIEKINLFFNDKEIVEINLEKINQIKRDLYEQNGYDNPLSIEIEYLYFICIQQRKTHSLNDIVLTLDNDFFVLKFLKNLLDSQKKTDVVLVISDSKKQFIQSLCDSLIDELNFNEIVKVDSKSSFTINKIQNDSIKLLIYYFINHDIKIQEGKLIQMIKYFELENTDDSGEKFNEYINKIKCKKEVDIQIVKNLINKNNDLTDFMYKKHINYVLEHGISEAYLSVKEYFKNNSSIYSGDKLYIKYLNITSDKELIESHLIDCNNYSFWSTVKYLLDKENILQKEYKVLLIEKAKKYLNSENIDFNVDAIKILFFYKDEDAIDFYLNIINRKLTREISISSFNDYDVLKNQDFSVVKKLYNALNTVKKDSFEYSYANTFITTYISNISNNESDFDNVMKVLNSIKIPLEQDKEENDNELFYLNLLIDAVTNNFINKLSKPLSFEDALMKVNDIMG